MLKNIVERDNEVSCAKKSNRMNPTGKLSNQAEKGKKEYHQEKNKAMTMTEISLYISV